MNDIVSSLISAFLIETVIRRSINMSSMVENTTDGTFTKATDLPTTIPSRMIEGAMNILMGEAVAPEVSQMGGLAIGGGALLIGDHLGVKAGNAGKGPLWKLRKAE